MAGFKGITINTAPETEPHIYAEDDAAIYQSIFGPDGVTTIGQQCKATTLSNNKVRISDGVVIVGGHVARIPYGEYEDCEIANGQSEKKRNDIIIGKIVTTGSGGIDTMTCEVKQGVSGTSATDPILTQDNIYQSGKIREIPLYRVKIEGLSIVAVEKMFKTISSIPELEEMLTELNSKMLTEEFTKTANGYTYNVEKYTFGNQKRAIVHGTWTGEINGLTFAGFYQGTIQNLLPIHTILGLSIKRVVEYNFRCSSGGGSLMILGTATITKMGDSVGANVQFAKSQAKNTCTLEWDMEVELQ